MFIIEKQLYKNYAWNQVKRTNETVEPYLSNPGGSDNTILCDDLKTIRGILKRYNNWIYNGSFGLPIVQISIFKVTSWYTDTSKLKPIHVIKLNTKEV